MKKITPFLIYLVLFSCIASHAQNVGIGTATPDSTAKLEISSTSKGLLIPRMTELQRNAILNPATGLMIFQTDQTPGTYFFNGTQWLNLSDNLGNHTATQIMDMDTNRIINVAAPVLGLDAVNKDYVDAAVGSGGGTGASVGAGMPSEISKESPGVMRHGECLIYCDSLSEGGHADWVIPNLDQLVYAVGGGCVIPDSRTSTYLWTRKPNPYYSGYWFLMRTDGYLTSNNGANNTSYKCRCIR